MLFAQILNRDLGCASYLLADGGEAIVVDPRWEVEVYRELARREGLRITHVIDTHDHADHISGRARLASLTGAHAHRPARDGETADGDLADGDVLSAGSLRVTALATPGHRPEHLALAVCDRSRALEPWLVLSGDSLLVGDLARPDLAVVPELGARQLRHSVRRLLALGDHVELWPGHVGGSLCGGPGLSAKTSSTIGFERRHNALIGQDEEAFVAILTANVPPRPPNLAQIVARNRGLVAHEPAEPREFSLEDLRAAIGARATIVDTRDPITYDEGHIAGSINLPASSSAIGTRAGWAIGAEQDIVVVAESGALGREIAMALDSVGLSRQLGIAGNDPDGWRRAGLAVQRGQRWDVAALASALRRSAVDLVDVRDEREWQTGHVTDSRHLPLHRLGDGLDALPRLDSRPLAVACAGGGRAAFAASLLRRAGARHVLRVAGGGIGDLPAHGIPLSVGA
ncbi:MAG: rhodanese-like domain-containing protein [Solirubrobacteraceae bacterium]